jgi:hypothetical protein
MKTGFLITAGVVLILGAMVVFWAIGVSNDEVKLRNTAVAQQESNQAFYGKLWQILHEKAGVADEYKESFKEIYVPLIEGRYSQGDGSLMKWITEHNPEFDASLYKDLMATIEGQRNGFFTEQQKLIDINREHTNMRTTIPRKWIVGKRTELGIVIINPVVATEAFKTGVEPETNLFNRDKK